MAHVDWKIGDRVQLRLPGTPWHRHRGAIVQAETRRVDGSIRFTVKTDAGREVYASAGQLNVDGDGSGVSGMVANLGQRAAARGEPYRLYLIHMPGCSHCEATKPVIAAFKRMNPDVRVTAVDLTVVEWKATAWMPTMTPTVIVLKPGVVPTYALHEGTFAGEDASTTEHVEGFVRWIRKHVS